MNPEQDLRTLNLQPLLSRELNVVVAPDGLWYRIQARLNEPGMRNTPQAPPIFRIEPVWLVAAGLTAFLLFMPNNMLRRITPGGGPDIALDLAPYLLPVQEASSFSSAPAIAQAPPHFADEQIRASAPLAGFTVSLERTAAVHGEPVKQVVLASDHDAVALFIASPRVRLDAGQNHWVQENVNGVNCKRLNCSRLHSFQFPCAAENCVLVCKSCSETLMISLMTAVTARAVEFK